MEEREQKAIIKKSFEEADLKNAVGDAWFLINAKWWQLWKDFVHYDGESGDPNGQKPGSIDNTDLLENGKLRPNMLEQESYWLLPESAWQFLLKW
jgi:hypothetical protein